MTFRIHLEDRGKRRALHDPFRHVSSISGTQRMICHIPQPHNDISVHRGLFFYAPKGS